jgi:hypothetical protein
MQCKLRGNLHQVTGKTATLLPPRGAASNYRPKCPLLASPRWRPKCPLLASPHQCPKCPLSEGRHRRPKCPLLAAQRRCGRQRPAAKCFWSAETNWPSAAAATVPGRANLASAAGGCGRAESAAMTELTAPGETAVTEAGQNTRKRCGCRRAIERCGCRRAIWRERRAGRKCLELLARREPATGPGRAFRLSGKPAVNTRSARCEFGESTAGRQA